MTDKLTLPASIFFFPEKRDFFLNDTDLFTFGRIGDLSNVATSRSSDNNGRPFFSRRLGLSRSGQPVDLKYGGKISGRMGRWNIGMLAIRQDRFETVNASNVFVGRLSANVLNESELGMILSAGDPNSNLDNKLGGVDFRFLNTRLPGGRVLEADAWYQLSATEGLDSDESAFGVGIRMPNNSGLRGGLSYKEIGENFNPALGFVSRSNVRDATADIGYTYFPDSRLIQEVFAGVDFQQVNFLGGGLQSRVLVGRLLEIQSNSRDNFSLHYTATKEVLTNPFTIYEDNARQVIVPPGTYSFGEGSVTLSTGRHRDLSASLTYSYGDFFGGTRQNINPQFTWRQSRYFSLSVGYDWNDISLPQGDFITRVAVVGTEVNFTPTIYWVSLLQYDNVSEVFGINSRLVWIPEAGQEALIVVNHRMSDPDKDNSFQSELNDITLKLNYTFRF